jgi:hypothetical protein
MTYTLGWFDEMLKKVEEEAHKSSYELGEYEYWVLSDVSHSLLQIRQEMNKKEEIRKLIVRDHQR